MLDPTFQTLLILNGMGVPVYSARGLTQTLTPINQAFSQDRTINGVLLDTSYSQFHKYQSQITCKDMVTPRMDGIWPGQQLTVSCVCELCYPVGGSPGRTPVSGSSRTANGFVFYRPVLTMMLGAVNTSKAEWAGDVSWTVPLVEV